MLKAITLAVFALCIHIVNVAQADTLAHTFSIPQQDTTWIEPLAIPRFDPQLGTLTGVHVEFDEHVRSTLALTVTTATSSNWTVSGYIKASVRTTLEYAGSGADLCEVGYREPPLVFWIDQESQGLLPYTLLQGDQADSHAQGDVAAIDLPLWIGAGNIPLTLIADGTSSHYAQTTYSIPGSVSWYLQSMQTVGVEGQVVYEFEPKAVQ